MSEARFHKGKRLCDPCRLDQGFGGLRQGAQGAKAKVEHWLLVGTQGSNRECSLKSCTNLAPKEQAVLSRVFEQHSCVPRCARRVSHPKCDRACRPSERQT